MSTTGTPSPDQGQTSGRLLPTDTGNPVLDGLHQKFNDLTPDEHQVLIDAGIHPFLQARTPPIDPGFSPRPSGPNPDPGFSTKPTPAPSSTALATPAIAPALPKNDTPQLPTPPPISSIPTNQPNLPQSLLGSDSLPAKPTTPFASGRANPQPLSAQHIADQAELDRLKSTGSGLSRLPGIARIPLQIGQALLMATKPGQNILPFIPGSDPHHQALIRGSEASLANDIASENAASRQGLENAQRDETTARANGQGAVDEKNAAEAEEARLRGASLLAPKAPEGKTVTTEDGIFELNPDTGKYDIKVGEAPGKNSMQHVVTPDGSVVAIEHDPKTGKATASVVYKGDPKIDTDLAQLQVNGKPHAVVVNKQTGETIKDLGESGIKPPVTNNISQTNELDRITGTSAKPFAAMRTAANGQLDRILDAQMMVAKDSPEALALAIPKVLTALVSGQGTGVRITQPELNAIANARVGGPYAAWLQKTFTGKSLSQEQRKQISDLMEDIGERIRQKQAIAGQAEDEISAAPTREAAISAAQKYRKMLDDLESGKSSSGKTFKIPAEQVSEFLKDYPNAVKNADGTFTVK